MQTTPLLAGLAIGAAAYAARTALVSLQGFRAAGPRMRQFYKGGFLSEMTRREASLILGKKRHEISTSSPPTPLQDLPCDSYYPEFEVLFSSLFRSPGECPRGEGKGSPSPNNDCQPPRCWWEQFYCCKSERSQRYSTGKKERRWIHILTLLEILVAVPIFIVCSFHSG